MLHNSSDEGSETNSASTRHQPQFKNGRCFECYLFCTVCLMCVLHSIDLWLPERVPLPCNCGVLVAHAAVLTRVFPRVLFGACVVLECSPL